MVWQCNTLMYLTLYMYTFIRLLLHMNAWCKHSWSFLAESTITDDCLACEYSRFLALATGVSRKDASALSVQNSCTVTSEVMKSHVVNLIQHSRSCCEHYFQMAWVCWFGNQNYCRTWFYSSVHMISPIQSPGARHCTILFWFRWV